MSLNLHFGHQYAIFYVNWKLTRSMQENPVE